MGVVSPVAKSLFALPAGKPQAHKCPPLPSRQGTGHLGEHFWTMAKLDQDILAVPHETKSSLSPSFVFPESMSRGWGLLPLQGHVLVGFWVSKVAEKGPRGCPHLLAFAALICHHSSSLMSFPQEPAEVSQAVSGPASELPSQIPCVHHLHPLPIHPLE